jgi:hypothetical protein
MQHAWGQEECICDDLGESQKERDHWEDQHICGWIIIKWDGVVWIGLIWFRIGTSGGLL